MSWTRQVSDPLYPDIIWNSPQRKDQSASIVVIGGHKQHLKAPLKAFEILSGQILAKVDVALPAAAKKDIGNLPNVDYFVSDNSGGFGLEAAESLNSYASNHDLVYLVGNLGKGSQTAQLVEQLLEKTSKQVLITGDSIDLLLGSPHHLTGPNRTIVVSTQQWQRLLLATKHTEHFHHRMTLDGFATLMENYSRHISSLVVVFYLGHVWSAKAGVVIATKRYDLNHNPDWKVEISSHMAYRLAQNPNHQLEAAATAALKTDNQQSDT